jgi:cell division protease FtsH
VRLGGRAAELVELEQGSTGAANDLASATDLATRMVREFGLSPALGPVGYPEGGSVFLGGGGGQGLSSRPFAEATQAVIDSEVARLLREAEQSAVALIRSHRDELGRLVGLLLEKETVDGEDVYRIVGRAMPVHRPTDALVMAPHMASLPDPPGHPASAPPPPYPASAPDSLPVPGVQAARGADGEQ